MPQSALEVWRSALAVMEQELGRTSFDNWLRPTRAVAIVGTNLLVSVPNAYTREWLETSYASLVQRALRETGAGDLRVHYLLPGDDEPAAAPSSPAAARPAAGDRPQLNPKYVFDTFVVGNSNRFAHAAALAVAESPSRAYNPLFIYGGVGLGKTHLMHAIGHYILAKNPEMSVVYVSSETFTNELINCIKDDEINSFRAKYREKDVLLIDDIQFLENKERTQEEFFHTFNALHEANHQIIVSSDRPPKELSTLEDRLRSRFEWGLITDIQPPDLETRVAILRKKAQLENLTVPDDALEYIATRITSNIRELEGALIRLVAYAQLHQAEVSAALAEEALRDILPENRRQPITISRIQSVVAEYFHLRPEDLRAKRRTRNVAEPRQIAMYLARELTDASLPKIGDEFGGRDHTTVLHGCEKIAAILQTDPNLRSTIKRLREAIQDKAG
ncbi:MAG TPA: chromosomal replication initiator protein DnaA [Firmicutes bacterium]|uniref:chromosomal replication initiator protein DnaA n=1 Tax=Gelria sp. Kuro-4 TaxID=2796927 RepID=UPI0019AABD8B|nr:chromosomal replication initiator protein DnaA [Gelria sp. Kuro-4]BCV23768.1 chromosomal replication initiator protein DnaA [Gelria sp. Kuro-4]HHV56724.1 chromosomal replication initiator protein DnaA [Bacillota bacterium]